MAKLTAWLVTLIGILLVLIQLKVLSITAEWISWVIALSVFVLGITKLMRNYQTKRRR